jgi:hypothetical protein
MRQTKLAIFLSIALLCLGCQGTKRKRAAINEQPKEEYIEYASDGFVRKYFDTQFNLVHYKSKAAYYREAYYANGQPIVDSIAKDYYITGELQFIGHIASENPDVLFGLGTWYYKNGNIETKYSLNKKGEIEGKCLSYYNSGKLKSEYYYKDGIMNGNSTEYYNEDLKLLKCKSGYILKDGTCTTHCYETCETRSEHSDDITNQKCETCKTNFILDSNRNCITPPTTIITTIVTTISTTILTTIPKKS